MTRRLLFVSYHFPPRPGVASMRTRNLVTHLPDHDWEVDVVAGPVGPEPDSSLTAGLDLGRVMRVEPSRGMPRVQGLDWSIAAFPVARRLARDADAVLISGGPFMPFLLGRLLRRPYVLDLRDPWSWDPRFGRLERRPRRRLAFALEERAEAAAFRSAAAAVTVAPEIELEYRRLYPWFGDRLETIRHGFEPADLVPDVVPSRVPELVYAGTFLADERTPDLIVRTAQIVRARGVPLEVRLLGTLAPELRTTTRGAEAEGWLHVEGTVSHSTSVTAMQQASVLWVQPGTLRFLITGKVFEYLGAGRPIVAVAPPDGALAALLAETGGGVVCDESPESCADAVAAALTGDFPPRAADVVSELTAPRIAKRLAALLDRVAA